MGNPQYHNHMESLTEKGNYADRTTGALPRILPFAVFIAFIGVEELVRTLMAKGVISLSPEQLLYLYPLKAIVTLATLFYFRNAYTELIPRDLGNLKILCQSIGMGIVVFVLWINMDWLLPFQNPAEGFDPTRIPEGITRYGIIAMRLAGAAIVVPIMEELFWRSFLIRYLINEDFSSIQIGFFTFKSCLITIVLFGLEHQFIIAGIMAGILYNLLLYRTRSIAACIASHALTNLLLGLYVLKTGAWRFW